MRHIEIKEIWMLLNIKLPETQKPIVVYRRCKKLEKKILNGRNLKKNQKHFLIECITNCVADENSKSPY